MFDVYYVSTYGANLFTVVCTPEKAGKYPVVIMRNPYVSDTENLSDEQVAENIAASHANFTDAGYAVVYQHCRGRGKSDGEFVPYIIEREDGLFLRQWIRKQPFYNGELYLCGTSYTASVHYTTAPFEDDIKGAVFNVQDCERYNCSYHNGFYRIGHGGWYVGLYKQRSIPKKNYVPEVFNATPIENLSEKIFGEKAEDFDEILKHPDRNDPFWNTRYGGGEAHDAVKHARIPVLLTTGFYDYYVGGVFDMWRGLDEETRSLSALIVHPYDHGGSADGQPIEFENATLKEKFGDHQVKWFDHIRKKEKPFVETGKVTYYRLFGDGWLTDGFSRPEHEEIFFLGEGERSFTYDPCAPATFKGGLTADYKSNVWQDGPDPRCDIISFFTPEFSKDTFVKGKMKAKLTVRTDCEDTCFYVRLILVKKEGYYALRDDINQISNFNKEYKPNEEQEMDFSFEDHAFIVKKGEKIRIDVSSSDFPSYNRHTNLRGLFSEQTATRTARNTVILNKSYLSVFCENP